MELEILHAIQSVANPALDDFFTALSVIGEPILAALILSAVYWVWNKEQGEYFLFAVLCGLCVNGLVKNLVNAPRPIGQEGVRTLYAKTATGSSFPSGHTQNAATLCGAAAWRQRSRGTALLLLVPPVLIGLSRLYLGVHWPRDVLASLVLGLLVSAGAYAVFRALDERGRELAAIVLALAFLVPAILWGDGDFVKGYGMLAGFAAGVPLEHRLVRFSTEGTPRRKALRWALGLAVLGVVKLAGDLLLPQALLFDGISYGAVAFAMTFLCPLLFKRWKL